MGIATMTTSETGEHSQENRKVQMTLEGKTTPEDWSFTKADTSYLTHGLHDYPARMIPQIAQRLIERYTPNEGIILDPFCGSGTTLVEAQLANRSAIGIDINPFAVLLSKVKATAIDFKRSDFDAIDFFSSIQKEYSQARREGKLPQPPIAIFPNLLHWFKEIVACDLEFLYQKIMEVEDEDIQDFLKIVLSDTIFKTSNIDQRSSRFIRILHEAELAKFNPEVLDQFHKTLIDSVSRMNLYVRRLKKLGISTALIKVRKGDARHLAFSKAEFDGAITSPPYGEEKNTIGYARWSKLSVAWLRLNDHELKESEKTTLGAITSKDTLERLSELESPTALNVLGELMKTDPERVKDALPFFFDYLETLKEVDRVLKSKSYYCVVIGDRSIRRKMLNMEKVSVELAVVAGFKHVKSFFRNIPMKLIPWSTPTGKTISRESIIVLQKK
jgi:DNA modification methylase